MQALQELARDRLEAGLSADADYLREVHALVVLRHGTPRHLVECVAGDHQATQTNVAKLSVADFLRLFCREPKELALKERVLNALRKSGWPRLDTPVCTPFLVSVSISSFFARRRPT